jgi:hypothetical protein
MSTVFTEPINLADLLKYEEVSQGYSRDIVTAAPNLTLPLGTVVGMITSSTLIKALNTAATDGSQNAYGILLHDVDTTQTGKHEALILARHSVVSKDYVVWPVGISAGDKATATAQLKTLGILIRQGA